MGKIVRRSMERYGAGAKERGIGRVGWLKWQLAVLKTYMLLQ